MTPSHTDPTQSDLDNELADNGNLGKEADMVRMFRRLLRGGTKHYVTGYWVW